MLRVSRSAGLWSLGIGLLALFTYQYLREKPVEARSAASLALEPVHLAHTARLGGELIATTNEPGQTFSEFKRGYKDRGFTALYIQPIGSLNAQETVRVGETAAFLSAFYHAPCTVLKSVSDELVPESMRRIHGGKTQFNATYVLDHVLKPRRPDDAIAVLAITATDLYPSEQYNFVFGLASLSQRVGVWSLSRYGDPRQDDFRRRLFKVAVHETGHMFGIPHCVAFDCLMNYVNNRPELDRVPMWFCPECVQKVAYARKLEIGDYLRSLSMFAVKHDLENEGDFWNRSADAVRGL